MKISLNPYNPLLMSFCGNPPIIVPKLIEVKDFMSKVAAFQTQYNDHIKQYTSTQGTVANIQSSINSFFGSPQVITPKLIETKDFI